jgi:hypothetical protein
MESEMLLGAVKQRPILFERNRMSHKDAERNSRAQREIDKELHRKKEIFILSW